MCFYTMNKKNKILFVFLIGIIVFSCSDKKEQTEKPVQNIDSLLIKDPNNVSLLIKRSSQYLDKYLKSGEIQLLYNSKNDAAKAFKLDSNNYEARMSYAESMSRTPNNSIEDYYAIKRHYNWLLNKKKTPKSYVGLASAYSFLQNPDLALKYADSALRLDKKYRDAYIIKGKIFIQQQKIKLAISSYETAVQQDKNFYQAYLFLGNLYTEIENYTIALERFKNATSIKPKLADAWYGVAMSEQMLQNYTEAYSGYKKLLDVDPQYYVAWFNLGWIKQNVDQQLDSAIIFYQNALEVHKDFVKAHHNIGVCYEQKGDESRALRAYGQALKYNPNYKLSIDAVNNIRK